jgi:hypothetical protein
MRFAFQTSFWRVDTIPGGYVVWDANGQKLPKSTREE